MLSRLGKLKEEKNAPNAVQKNTLLDTIQIIQSRWKLFGFAALAIVSFTGCSMLQPKHLLAPCGVNDYIEIPIGGKIEGVKLPTDEQGKTYTVVTPKTGFWISQECDERIGR
jgi:hypothetical protein